MALFKNCDDYKKVDPHITIDDVRDALLGDGWDIDNVNFHYAADTFIECFAHPKCPVITLLGHEPIFSTLYEKDIEELGFRVHYLITGAKHFVIVGWHDG